MKTSIARIREKFHVSPAELALLFGVREATIIRLEIEGGNGGDIHAIASILANIIEASPDRMMRLLIEEALKRDPGNKVLAELAIRSTQGMVG
jgi:hypothetical protein